MLRTLAVLLLAFAGFGCASQQQQNAQTIANIKQYSASLPGTPTRTIPLITDTGNPGSMDVFGNLDQPSCLRVTIGLSTSQIINHYYFKDRLLLRATTQRYYSKYVKAADGKETYVPQSTKPGYTYDVFFDNDVIIGRSSTGTADDLDRLEPQFPDRRLIDQLQRATRADKIQIDLTTNPLGPAVISAN